MEKCRAKELLYNSKTKRCYKSCEQKKKETHPVTKKCRKYCSPGKIRRTVDFRCVKQVTLKKRGRKEPSTEELIPPPLQKELVKNFQFIDDLIAKGQNKRIEYEPASFVSDLITIYFHEKYKQQCPMYPIRSYSAVEVKNVKEHYELTAKAKGISFEDYKQNLKTKYKSDFMDWDSEKFLKNLKLCLETGEQIIVIPLQIPGHLNMLIIKVATREIIRFEPHGAKYDLAEVDTNTNQFLENLVKEINVYLNLNKSKAFKYVDPTKLCPYYKPKLTWTFYEGFQSVESTNMEKAGKEGSGFCQLWGWFFAECVINNPELPIKEVYNEAYYALKEDEMNFATVIRGYFFSINEELKKMRKKFSIKSDYINANTDNEVLRNKIFIDYLNKRRTKLRDKPRKPFVGGLNAIKKFVLPMGAGPYKPNWGR
jgi:hypothetical protein